MALYKIKESPTGIIPYTLWDGSAGGYQYTPRLIVPPRLYIEEVSRTAGFYYVPPPVDKYVLATWFTYLWWPSWEYKVLYFDADTGEYAGKADSASLFGSHYTSSCEIGPDGWVYACRAETTKLYRLKWDNMDRADSWEINPYTWTPGTILQYAIVNLLDDTVTGISSWDTTVWRNISTTPELVYKMRNPDITKDMAYEDRTHCWMLGTANYITKFDSENCRVEMSSMLPSFAGDLQISIAYDTFRKQLAVMRVSHPLEDGSDASKIEFYLPTPKMYGLSSPIPINPIKMGEKINFVSQVYGEAGESVGGSTLTSELVAPNNNGTILTPVIGTDLGGDGRILYKAPNAPATEEMKVTLNIPDELTDL